jgi:hypothetical protein
MSRWSGLRMKKYGCCVSRLDYREILTLWDLSLSPVVSKSLKRSEIKGDLGGMLKLRTLRARTRQAMVEQSEKANRVNSHKSSLGLILPDGQRLNLVTYI